MNQGDAHAKNLMPSPHVRRGSFRAWSNDLPGPNDSTKRYDISIKVGNTVYVVLYTPPPGTYGFQYSAGQDMLVSVGNKTITYNDLLGNSRQVPIVSRSPVPAKSVP